MSAELATERAGPGSADAKDPNVSDSKSEVLPDARGEDKAKVLVASVDKNEPLVTRKELWSYYRECSSCIYAPLVFVFVGIECIITETTVLVPLATPKRCSKVLRQVLAMTLLQGPARPAPRRTHQVSVSCHGAQGPDQWRVSFSLPTGSVSLS